MSDESASGQSWSEVGAQFKVLGESLARAFRTGWEDANNRERLREVQSGVSSMLNEIGKAIQETSESDQGQRVRAEVEQAARSAQSAGEQAWREAEPHIVSALRQLNVELGRVIEKLDRE